ncbi:Gfo/Idh/MocA family protein [Alkalicoccobacillus porphyridii]|uniref:Gfo/Idh/MocA family oxidoreductase n=1 Tax=Alkalicoccobacillus porphyridii TaxID=2597270 RepID=A0A553ZX34_9BACI|nr:Gfo/Idh/MocA family oxidoreductase [Alkalicoccobacillus porphyridii]TSB46028.1 Gfo/Idh/MocA family oxidoreductase [Alkalicoccobacillus porphyridii]
MKIGIISFAHMHALSYASSITKHRDAELTCIWDADVNRGKEMANQFNTHFYPSLDELLNSDIDAVIICSENVNHREHVLKAANHQKHILCEKPIATEVEAAVEMIEACKKHNVILQVAYPVRFSTPIQEVNQLIKAGEIGEVLAVNATNHGQMPGGWFVDQALSGGGAATDHIVHIMDLLRWILEDEVSSVYAELDTRFYDIDVEDCGLVLLEMESGTIVSIDPSWSRPKTFPTWGDVTLEIVGTEGSLSVDALKEHSLFYNDKANQIEQKPWGEDMDEKLVEDFIQCVKEGRSPFISGIDGLRTLEVVKAAYQADKTKQAVSLKRFES